MYTSVKKLLDEGLMSKWVKVSEEEIQCIVDSIPGENMLRNASHNKMDGTYHGDNLRHHVDRGYIVVVSTFSKEAEKHPLDLQQKEPETKITIDGPQAVSAVAPEKGVFAINT